LYETHDLTKGMDTSGDIKYLEDLKEKQNKGTKCQI